MKKSFRKLAMVLSIGLLFSLGSCVTCKQCPICEDCIGSADESSDSLDPVHTSVNITDFTDSFKAIENEAE